LSTEKTAAHHDALKKQITEIHRQIEIAQRAPVAPEVTAAAIEQARRDQDALTSPVLEDLRETAEKLSEDIEHAWLGVSRTTTLADTLAGRRADDLPSRALGGVACRLTEAGCSADAG
jgi:hypothetical protein